MKVLLDTGRNFKNENETKLVIYCTENEESLIYFNIYNIYNTFLRNDFILKYTINRKTGLIVIFGKYFLYVTYQLFFYFYIILLTFIYVF